MSLPNGILAAASDPEGSRWVLVIGAGASVEPPTDLPTGADCSLEAHRRLRQDGVLPADSANPSDLSLVADDVFAATGSQRDVVRRLPQARFRSATPNSGHLIAAALLVENSLAGVVTLNFDLAMSTALAHVGAGDSVAEVAGPDDIPSLSMTNLVYLHRNANAPAEDWVLRTIHLNSVWTDRWEPVMAARVLVSPTIVFAGLGSPAAVLTETVGLIRGALPEDAVSIYQVDPAPFGELPFTGELGLPEEHYVQRGWCDFMDEVAQRVATEHWTRLETACRATATDMGYAPLPLEPIANACRELGLLGCGIVRARWLLQTRPYASMRLADSRLIADVLLNILFVASHIGGNIKLREDGVVEFRDGPRLVAALGFATASGSRSLVAAEAALATQYRYSSWRGVGPQRVVITGHVAAVGAPTAPVSIVPGPEGGDILESSGTVQVLSAYELRAHPDRIATLEI